MEGLSSCGSQALVKKLSRRTSLHYQTMAMLSTPEGQSLLDADVQYPWAAQGFLRYPFGAVCLMTMSIEQAKSCGKCCLIYVMTRLRAEVPRWEDIGPLEIKKNESDLTLKLKDIKIGSCPALEKNMRRSVTPVWPIQQRRVPALLKVKASTCSQLPGWQAPGQLHCLSMLLDMLPQMYVNPMLDRVRTKSPPISQLILRPSRRRMMCTATRQIA